MKTKFQDTYSFLVAIALFFSCTNNEIISTEEPPTIKTVTKEIQKEEAYNFKSRQTTVVSGNEWMKNVPNNTPLSQLSIPGTHDSGALHEGWPGTAKCQTLKIEQQLQIGVRFLDIRCRHFNNDFSIHHGPVYQHQNFSDVLKTCVQFLKENPSEVIVMSVKPEHTSRNNNQLFYQRFNQYVNEEANGIFYLEDRIPLVSEVRGKIVLVRRFGAPNELGIQARNGWRDNTTFTIQNINNNVVVQDAYKVENFQNKWNLFLNTLNQARNNSNINNLYLNFLSGYKPIFFIPNITSVSNFMNPSLKEHLRRSSKNKSNGIVIVDFVDTELAKLIYSSQIF